MKVFSIIKEKSERIPEKNFADLSGRPVWRWLVDELEPFPIYINTDCPGRLIEAGLPKHVHLIERDEEHVRWENDPKITSSPVLDMVRAFIETEVDDQDEIVVLTHVTSPFLKKETVSRAIELLDEGWKSVHSVEVLQDFVWMETDKGSISPVNFETSFVQRTQDLPRLLVSKGAFFMFRAKDFIATGNRLIEPIFRFPLSRVEAIDLDTPDDLELARTLARGLES